MVNYPNPDLVQTTIKLEYAGSEKFNYGFSLCDDAAHQIQECCKFLVQDNEHVGAEMQEKLVCLYSESLGAGEERFIA